MPHSPIETTTDRANFFAGTYRYVRSFAERMGHAWCRAMEKYFMDGDVSVGGLR